MNTATKLPKQRGAGAGEVNASAAVNAVTDLLGLLTPANSGLTASKGTGSLEASRGTSHIFTDANNDGLLGLLTGDTTVWGTPWNGKSWSTDAWTGYQWKGRSWSDSSWSGKSWG